MHGDDQNDGEESDGCDYHVDDDDVEVDCDDVAVAGSGCDGSGYDDF